MCDLVTVDTGQHHRLMLLGCKYSTSILSRIGDAVAGFNRPRDVEDNTIMIEAQSTVRGSESSTCYMLQVHATCFKPLKGYNMLEI